MSAHVRSIELIVWLPEKVSERKKKKKERERKKLGYEAHSKIFRNYLFTMATASCVPEYSNGYRARNG